MDGFELIISIVSLVNRIIVLCYDALQSEKFQQYFLLARVHGKILAGFVTLAMPQTAKQYWRIHHSILRGSKEEAMVFRQAITDECSMTAVAVSFILARSQLSLCLLIMIEGAIIAQVAITALSLPSLSSMHWIARASFLTAVTSGCLSVFYACQLQRIIGKLYEANQIKGWLMLPLSKGRIVQAVEEQDIELQETSLAAVLILSAPFTMVKVSIFSFLIGLATYQGFLYTRNLDSDAGPDHSRDSFIALVGGTGLCYLFFLLTFSAKSIESTVRSHSSRADGLIFPKEPGDKQLNRRDFQEIVRCCL